MELLPEMGLGSVVSVASIEVVLPTYNGVLYLEAQIASIYNQTLRPERVLLRDDGSSDGTQALISQLQQQYGIWLQALPADGNLGCTANVNRLLQATTAPYVALADQDDLWLPQKLEVSLKKLQQLENHYGTEIPLLVHSDLELVDQDGTSLGCRYLKRQRLNPLRTAPADLALTNVVTGCTVLVNRALLEKALPIPTKALMHDWWLALVATVFGQIEFLPNPLVYYRQHSNNAIGAQGLSLGYYLRRLYGLARDPAACGTLQAVSVQAHFFSQRYCKCISLLPDFISTSRRKRLLAVLAKFGTLLPRKHGLIRTVGLYGLLMLISQGGNDS